MNKKLKKIMATTLLSMTATTAIGCATNNSKIAQKINSGVNDFVSSINKLDYVDTNKTNSNLGKIVSAANETNFLSKVASTTNIENTITRPTERTDNFKLYVLSDLPYVSLTSNDNTISFSMQFSTEKIENTSDDINEKINKLILKRSILMVYVNEIYNGNVTLTDENKTAINAYVNVIKENASFLNGNRGMVKNQLGIASDLANKKSNDDIINYYIIKSGEALEIRSNKIDSTISAMNSIISILEQNLTSNSCYYQNGLNNAYDNMLSNLQNSTGTSNENTKLAKEIAESINLISPSTNTNKPVVINNTNTTNNENLNNKSTLNNQNNSSQNITTYPSINNTNNLLPLNYNNYTKDFKTQNNSKNTENQYNYNNNYNNVDNNQNDLTPSQRARLRRNRSNLNQNYNGTNTNGSTTNPTIKPETASPIPYDKARTIRADRTKDNQMGNQNKSTAQITTMDLNDTNRAVRVPYKVSSTNYTD